MDLAIISTVAVLPEPEGPLRMRSRLRSLPDKTFSIHVFTSTTFFLLTASSSKVVGPYFSAQGL